MNIIPRPFEVKETGGICEYRGYEYELNPSLSEEEYILCVKNGNARAVCGSAKAEYYARLTLEQIKKGGKVPDCEIHDKPRFQHRGFMIDSARHYQELDEIKKFIKAMSELKMNIFHWHLSEDQGWRIESETHPELNSAAVRKYSDFGKTMSDKPYGIYYTKDEIRDVVEYAAQHFIDVIPEFDIPGHTSAFLSVFPEATCDGKKVEVKTHQGIFEDVICPAKEASARLVKDVFDELCELFPYGVYHLGGDEVKHAHWENCPDCKRKMQELGITSYNDYENYFLSLISDYLKTNGKKCIVWNDAVKGKGLDKDNMIVQYWLEKGNKTAEYANGGGKIILSPFTYYYLDYDYDITSLRKVLSFKPEIKGLDDTGRENVLGVEAPLWTEFIDNNERLEELAFPRIIAVACTAWQEEGFTYDEFLSNASDIIEKFKSDGFSFRSKEHWGYPKAHTLLGWIRFGRTFYNENLINL